MKRTKDLLTDITAALGRLRIGEKMVHLQELEAELMVPEIWNNPQYAQEKSRELATLQAVVEPWLTLQTRKQPT